MRALRCHWGWINNPIFVRALHRRGRMRQPVRFAIIVSPYSAVHFCAVSPDTTAAMRLLTGFSRFMNDFPFPETAPEPAPASTPAMQLENDLCFPDDLPGDAKQLLDRADSTIADVRDATKREIAAIRDASDREIEVIRTRTKAEEARANAKASQELSPMLRDLFTQLKALQTEHLLAGRLDEAMAIRARARSLRGDLFGIKPDPGNMTEYPSADLGKSFLFDVVGTTDGNCWGHGLYTGDSGVATAAVHAGILRAGERAVVRVTLVDGSESAFESIDRYGVRSLEYGNYTVAFTVERV